MSGIEVRYFYVIFMNREKHLTQLKEVLDLFLHNSVQKHQIEKKEEKRQNEKKNEPENIKNEIQREEYGYN